MTARPWPEGTRPTAGLDLLHTESDPTIPHTDTLDPRPCQRCNRTVTDHVRAELDGLLGHGWTPTNDEDNTP